MRRRWLLGAVVIGLMALGSHGQPPADKGKQAESYSAAEKTGVPADLEALNGGSRKLYAGARALELSTIPAVIVVSGDDLVLRKNGKRTVVRVIPPEYHALKCVAHTTLALCTHLSHDPGKPLSEARLTALREYRTLMAAAGPGVEVFGFDLDTLTRQKRIVARGLEFADRVLKDGLVSADDLNRYSRASRPDVMANCGAAARAQLLATHRRVMAWKKEMTPDEWAGLTVIVQGAQTPRDQNAAVQYFARLFGENGEGRRVVYAEGLWDEDKAIALLGTRRLDGRLSVIVFNDPFRMYRDILADVARAAIDEILASP